MLAIFVLYVITLPIHRIVILSSRYVSMDFKIFNIDCFVKNVCMLAIFVLYVITLPIHLIVILSSHYVSTDFKIFNID